MKLFLSVGCALICSLVSARAGSELSSPKETIAPAPCQGWYRDSEWDLGISGIYAFTAADYPKFENSNGFLPLSEIEVDRYLETDHAWGGGIDAKYFFKRFFGVGFEGFVLDARQSYADVFVAAIGSVVVNQPFYFRTSYSREAVGSALATFTLRYPMGCSRFAPYVWLGGGTIFGGGRVTRSELRPGDAVVTFRSGSKTEAIGQVGGGFEVRITQHIGWTNDFSWNVVDGRDNNFGMARTGINFAF